MPPEPLPWDRKDFFKERKHDRSDTIGSVARWRDSSHHRDFNRWGSAEFRSRPPGHGKQGGWHMFSEEPGHGYGVSRSGDKMLEEDSRPSISRGDGKYGRSSRDNRGGGPFGQRDWRGHSWEATNGSLNLSRRPSDMNNDQRSVDDNLTHSSHPHSDFSNTWEQHHLKDQHDKMGSVNGSGTGPRCDRENSLGSIDWKPLKWTRSGSLCSRGSGFSHSSSSRSMAGTDSYEGKPDLKHKNVTAVESHSGEATACVTSSMLSEDTTSRKKPRLNWGEGLAKYEKKKVDVPDPGANKDGSVSSAGNMEPCNSISPNLVDKSPKVTGFSDCASPATPSSVACSSSPGVDDKLLGKTGNADNDVSNLTDSPAPGFQNHLQKFYLNLDKLDIDSLNNLGSSIVELVQSDDPSSDNSGLVRSNAINKLLIWKADISKVLEMTESEIDLLENELKSLKSESVDRSQCPLASGSQQADSSLKFYEEHVEVSQKVIRPVPLKIISSDEPNIEKMPQSNNLCSIHENDKEEDIDSPGSATSKFVQPLPLVNAVSSCDTRGYVNFSRDMNAVQSTMMKCLVRCSTKKNASVSACNVVSTHTEVKDSLDDATFGANLCSSYENTYNSIIASNKESANRAHEVFAKLVPEECKKHGNMVVSNDSSSHTFIMEKFAEKKRFERFKERVIALKFKALHHLWKEDMRLLSIRKCRPKSHKKNELNVRTTCSSNLKNRSSVRSRFTFPAGNHLSLVPTSEIINFTSNLLSESQAQPQRNTLKMPALILDEKEKMVTKFISSNGLVEDPLAIEKERDMINPWTSEEKEIFLAKFATFGKDFRKIASFLDHKTTADCVEFYYKNHKSECFEKLKRKDVGKLGKSYAAKTNLMASGNKRMRAGRFLLGYGNVKPSRGEDSIIERSNSFDTLGDERETAAAADVLAGICGSLSSEAMSSCITSSIDPVDGNRETKFLKANPLFKQPLTPDISQNADDETCSDESYGEVDLSEWTDDEKAAFMHAISSFGKDFAKIARCVGTRSQEHCRVFFSKTRKVLGLNLVNPIPGINGSPLNDDANGGESDTDDACVVETGSVVDADKSGNKTDEDLPSDALNTFHDESNPLEAMSLSAELNESREISGTEVCLENVDVASDVCAIKVESKLGSDVSGVGLGKTDKSGSVNEVGLGDAVRESISASGIIKPRECGSVAVDRPISQGSSGGLCLGNEVERQRVSAPQCVVDRDDKHVEDAGAVVELKSCVLQSCPAANVSFSPVVNSCSGLSFGSENKHVSFGKPHTSALSMNDHRATANSLLLKAGATQCEKTVSQDRLSSTCDIQGGRDMRCHSSGSNGDHQLPLSGSHVETVSVLQGYPMQVPIKKEVDGDVNCSSSEFPLLPQKVNQTDDQFKTLCHSSDSEKTSRSGDVKLFGKILTNPSSTQKTNMITKRSEENGTHHPKLSNKSSNLNFTGHQNSDGNLKILKFDRSDYLGLENVPVMSYGYWEGNGIQSIQTGLSSLPDSSFLLAKYPAAFSNYPTSSSNLEQQPLQAFAKSSERHLTGASTFTARDMNGSNAMLDYQMFRSRDSPKVQPFMVDVQQRQDVFSEMQRRNSFEAISSLQQQGRGMMGINGVGRPGILAGGSCSGVSDPVAAIKMHYSNADKYGGQNGSISRDDESWGGKGDLGR
uniref:MYB family transcription factor n=1 Tax=Melilotus albus TaxID=47082 RepID=A0A896WCA8_MELAB|nr:MYB family transcription factor [Melilotus albus]